MSHQLDKRLSAEKVAARLESEEEEKERQAAEDELRRIAEEAEEEESWGPEAQQSKRKMSSGETPGSVSTATVMC